jgi:hypothetical protein
MKSPGYLSLLKMKWEKLGDWDRLMTSKTRLRIPGENYYRMWEQLRMGVAVLPLPKVGLEAFLLEAFVRMHELQQRRDVENQVYWTSVGIMLTQCLPEAKISQQVVDRIMAMFWRWHRTVEPGAIRPTGASSDDLLNQMDRMKEIFESQAGIEVMAADPLNLRREPH